MRRNIAKQLVFNDEEAKTIESAADHENLPLAVWARQILVESATKIEAAREEVARASNWSSYIKAKKLLNERELHR
jgi:hypothetical protein